MDDSQREHPLVKKIKDLGIEHLRNEIRKRRNIIVNEEQKPEED